MAATPLVIDGKMFLATALGRIISLDAATGRELWTFDAKVDPAGGYGDFVSRGVSYWQDTNGRKGERCVSRVIAGIVDARVVALDAADGRPCTDFGVDGQIDLRGGLRNPPAKHSEYELTSPAAIIDNVIVAGSAVADNDRTEAASGEVRGYDVRTGRRLWSWDPVPQDEADPAYATWQGATAHNAGGANTWSVITGDPARHLVVLPTSSPSVDYWGKGLIDVTIAGRLRPAVAQATKSGQLFVLDRDNGQPLFPVTEKAVPQSDAKGEVSSPTQPFGTMPLSPLAFSRKDIAEGISDPALREQCLAALYKLRNDGPFTPPSERGSLVVPSNIGGAHWGGVAYDPQSEVIVVPTNSVAAVVTLIPREAQEAQRAADGAAGERIGLEYARMKGSPYILRRELFGVGGRLCTPRPYGTLQAINLRTGRVLWNRPLGTGEGLPFGPLDGMVNLGGPIVTASGLVFIGATPDAYLRAFDLHDGRELWKGKLPAGARSTPMTYADSTGRQFVAVSAAGDGELFGSADEIVVFALPAAE
jgi:quinoprotein glucose dehydrogenase